MDKGKRRIREIFIILPYLLLLISVIFFLGAYRDMRALADADEKLKVQLDKTREKLDYYIYRDSTSLGHSEGPNGYEAYKKRLGR